MKKLWGCIVLWWSVAGLALGATAEREIKAIPLPAGERIVIDGRLDESAWQSAQSHALAFKFSPSNLDTTIPETTYRILVDGDSLYVGIDCRDPNPKDIRQELSHRDLVEGADSVKVWIDPTGQRKFAQIFKIAAGGAIWDGTHYDDSGRDDTAPDFPFEAASHVDEHGWSAEFKIPASSLRLNGRAEPTILVTRYVPRSTGFVFASTDINDHQNCTLCKNPTLTGLTGMQRGSALMLTPYVSATKHSGDFGSATQGRAGVDLKWRWNDSAVVDATLYPDFSQVELDTPQLSANAAYALFFPEKRPFFLEGLDLFDTPYRAVYTRTITKPSFGARITNRGDNNDTIVLAAKDDGGGSILLPRPWGTDLATQPTSTSAVARTRFHVYGSHAGVIAALKDYGDQGSNVLGGGDFVYSGQHDRYNAQILASRTTALANGGVLEKGDARDGAAEFLGWNHDSNEWHAHAITQHIDKGFRDDSGFIEAAGFQSGEVFAGRELKPVLGLSVFMPYLMMRQRETLTGETIATNYIAGLVMEPGAGSHFEVIAFPKALQRVNADLPLHRVSYLQSVWFANPARFMPEVQLIVQAGQRLDTLSDRVGSGYSVNFSPTFLLRTRLRIGATLAQEYIRGGDVLNQTSGQQRIWLRDSVVATNVSYFFDRVNELRGTYQHHESYRDPLAFSVPVTERTSSDLVSLVYTWTPSLGKAFYAGGT